MFFPSDETIRSTGRPPNSTDCPAGRISCRVGTRLPSAVLPTVSVALGDSARHDETPIASSTAIHPFTIIELYHGAARAPPLITPIGVRPPCVYHPRIE